MCPRAFAWTANTNWWEPSTRRCMRPTRIQMTFGSFCVNGWRSTAAFIPTTRRVCRRRKRSTATKDQSKMSVPDDVQAAVVACRALSTRTEDAHSDDGPDRGDVRQSPEATKPLKLLLQI